MRRPPAVKSDTWMGSAGTPVTVNTACEQRSRSFLEASCNKSMPPTNCSMQCVEPTKVHIFANSFTE